MNQQLTDYAKRFKDNVAFDDGRSKTTYGELLQSVNCGIQSLQASGVGQGDRVIWCPANEIETLLTFWSLLAMGCVACPVSDRFPEKKKSEIAEQIAAKWLPTISFEPNDSDVSIAPTITSNRNPPATITLSSGSTGKPKAIVHTLAAHIASASGAAANMPLSNGDRWLWSLPTYHVSGFSVFVRCAVAGATIVGMDQGCELNAGLLERMKVTHLSVVATQLRRLLGEDSFPSSSLKAVLLGGSTVSASLVDRARAMGVPVHTTYGLTETASQVTTSSTTCDSRTSGRLLPQRELKINKSMPSDGMGEILVRGATLCLGYFHGGQIDSVVDEEGWFHTRDRGSIDVNGLLTVSGRIDNMFISGGENIYPESIERALLELPSVLQAIVVPKDDAEFGSRPVAFIDGDFSWSQHWIEELRRVLRGFEVPIAFLQWPYAVEPGAKPSRSAMYELANERDWRGRGLPD